MRKNNHLLLHDVLIIASSILMAVMFVKTNVISTLLTQTKEVEFLSILIAGMFFTSIFTTAPAIVALGELALNVDSLWTVALIGGLGAMITDLVLFEFVKNNFSDHLIANVKKKRLKHKLQHVFHSKLFRVISFVVGGIIIASPLPDEIGISLMGLSKTRVSVFMILSFVFNSIGIFIIGLAARALF